MKQKLNFSALIIIIFFGFFIAGCAALKEKSAESTEQMLSAAGFTVKPADTPEKLAHLKTLTQEKVVQYEKDGKIYYIYANSYEKCLYIGNVKAYNEYKKLKHQKQVSEENAENARDELMAENEEVDSTAAMDWGLWAPYEY